jgi:hypothetical protein
LFAHRSDRDRSTFKNRFSQVHSDFFHNASGHGEGQWAKSRFCFYNRIFLPVNHVQFNPHLHLIVTDGCFSDNGTFVKGPVPEPKDLQELFRYEVLKMLKAEGKINDAVIENMLSWHHSGFNVYCGPTIWPNNDQGLEDLAHYIIRACFSTERMNYLPAKNTLDGQAKVIYRSKDGRTLKTFEALDWLAQLVTHIPNKGEQMVRYYGLCKALHKPYYAEFKIMLSLIGRATVKQIKSII